MSYFGISCWTRETDRQRESKRDRERAKEIERDSKRERETAREIERESKRVKDSKKDRERQQERQRETAREIQKLRYTPCVRLDELSRDILLGWKHLTGSKRRRYVLNKQRIPWRQK